MSTTQELVTLLQKQFKGWNRDGDRGILPYLNIAQRILCSVEADQLLIIDESTGKLPTITTTSGVYSYNLPATVNFVSQILIESSNYLSYDYGNSSRRQQRPVESYNISGISYYVYPNIRSYPANETSQAKVVFVSDPGTTEDFYRYMGYILPNDLVSESIAISIPPPYDYTILLPAAAKLLEGVQHGNYIDAIAYITKEFLPEMHKVFNRGAFGVCYDAEDHGF